MRKLLLISVLGPLAAACGANVDVSKLPPAITRPVDFARDVQPIFEANCWNCHGPKRTEAGFRLDQREAALKGGERGGDIIPGKSAESLLIHAVAHVHDELKMPNCELDLVVDLKVRRIVRVVPRDWSGADEDWAHLNLPEGRRT